MPNIHSLNCLIKSIFHSNNKTGATQDLTVSETFICKKFPELFTINLIFNSKTDRTNKNE